MSDKREEILQRLVAIAEATPGVKTVRRNEHGLNDDDLPAIIILDGHETADDNDPRGRPAYAPRRVAMTPEIWFLAAEQDDHDAKAPPVNVGSLLNAMRRPLLKAILQDAELQALCGKSGDIRYEGANTGLSRMRQMEAEIGLSVTFSYILKASDL